MTLKKDLRANLDMMLFSTVLCAQTAALLLKGVFLKTKIVIKVKMFYQ